ncbi:rhomboid family intramembrane serine protease [Ilyomonas limi]|uniref:Rhomboid family intramembrane serine protease n=1 Tax=Ilyomonas limi TaxID=2575867 RepID=A0A4U3L0K6_9BACT|nr:rhomboid family intramembrane serine protease [Ilyomonas limi]TKK67684.1 rhomboid family intramembrane serine protease [Ilyomonas limi]
MTEFRPGRFQILPTVIKNLLIINGLVFLAQNVFGDRLGFSLNDVFALHTFQSPLFKPWQFITHMFMHGSLAHIFGNMLALWMFGAVLENLWGPKRFLIFYIVCGLGAALCHMIVLYVETHNLLQQYNALGYAEQQAYRDRVFAIIDEPTLGASGAVFGCLAAFGYLFPNTYIYLYFLFPIKAKWFVIMYAAFELLTAIQNSAGDNVAHVAHLGGALVGFILVYFWNKNNRRNFY